MRMREMYVCIYICVRESVRQPGAPHLSKICRAYVIHERQHFSWAWLMARCAFLEKWALLRARVAIKPAARDPPPPEEGWQGRWQLRCQTSARSLSQWAGFITFLLSTHLAEMLRRDCTHIFTSCLQSILILDPQLHFAHKLAACSLNVAHARISLHACNAACITISLQRIQPFLHMPFPCLNSLKRVNSEDSLRSWRRGCYHPWRRRVWRRPSGRHRANTQSAKNCRRGKVRLVACGRR